MAVNLKYDTAADHVDKGIQLYKADAWNDAEAEFREAVRLDPQDGNAHTWLGASLQRLGRNDEAIVHCKQAVELYKESPDRKYPLRNWGNALRSKQLYREAETKYGEAVK